jgi:hypothetical protein
MNGAVRGMDWSRQARGLFMLFCLFGLVWMFVNWVMTGFTQMLMMGGLAIAMLIIALSTLNDWRNGLYMFLGWLLIEDLVRKYMGNGTALFFGKDVLAAITILSFFLAKQRGEVPWFRPRFIAPMALFFGLAVIQVFNPGSPSIIYGLLGLKLYFFYFPLIYVGYAMLETNRDLERFLIYSVVLGAAIAFLGIVQSVVGLSFLNPTELAPELEALGNLKRYSPLTGEMLFAPTSVFVSSGRFAMYVILVAILALGTQAYLLVVRHRRAIYGLLGVGVAVVAAMESGSRGCILYTIMSALVLSAAFLWGAPWRWREGKRLVRAVRLSFLVGGAGLFLMVQLFPKIIGANWAFYSETLSPTSSASDLQYRTLDYPLMNLELAFQNGRWLYGSGTGTNSLGMQYVASLLGQPPPSGVLESGGGVLVAEMGILGPILWLIWSGSLLYYASQIVRQLRETAYFPVAFSIFWYAFILLVPMTYAGMSPYQNYVMNAYFWVLIGILFRLPKLAQMQQAVPLPNHVRGMARWQLATGGR